MTRHAQALDTPTVQIFGHMPLLSLSGVTNFRHVPKNEQLIPTAQVAEMLGKDVRTVHRLAASGLLPHALKIPGRTGAWLFDRDVVEMYRRQTPTAA